MESGRFSTSIGKHNLTTYTTTVSLPPAREAPQCGQQENYNRSLERQLLNLSV